MMRIAENPVEILLNEIFMAAETNDNCLPELKKERNMALEKCDYLYKKIENSLPQEKKYLIAEFDSTVNELKELNSTMALTLAYQSGFLAGSRLTRFSSNIPNEREGILRKSTTKRSRKASSI